MSAKLIGLLGALLLGIIANDLWTLSSGLAHRIVVLAARLWSRDQQQAEVLAEEWQAHINDRPGQILKLLTALALFTAAIGRLLGRRLKLPVRQSKPAPIFAGSLRLPSIDIRAAETNAVAMWLVVGIIVSLAPLPLYRNNPNMSWAYFGWGIGAVLAVTVTASSVTLGFLVRPPLTVGPRVAPLRTSVPGACSDLETTQPQPPANVVLLVRPFIETGWQHEPAVSGEGSLVRPYVHRPGKPLIPAVSESANSTLDA